MSPDRLISLITCLGDDSLNCDLSTLNSARRHNVAIAASTPTPLMAQWRKLAPRAQLFACDDAQRRALLDQALWLARGALTPWCLLAPSGTVINPVLCLSTLAHNNQAAVIDSGDPDQPWLLLRRAFALDCPVSPVRFCRHSPEWRQHLLDHAMTRRQHIARIGGFSPSTVDGYDLCRQIAPPLLRDPLA